MKKLILWIKLRIAIWRQEREYKRKIKELAQKEAIEEQIKTLKEKEKHIKKK